MTKSQLALKTVPEFFNNQFEFNQMIFNFINDKFSIFYPYLKDNNLFSKDIVNNMLRLSKEKLKLVSNNKTFLSCADNENNY